MQLQILHTQQQKKRRKATSDHYAADGQKRAHHRRLVPCHSSAASGAPKGSVGHWINWERWIGCDKSCVARLVDSY
jgi:hypothetical protein